ncbi:MAG: PAS domain S-box protein [Bacteroidota bacterium]
MENPWFFEALFETAYEGLLLLDPSFQLVTANRTAKTLFSFSDTEEASVSLDQLFLRPNWNSLLEAIKQGKEEDPGQTIEIGEVLGKTLQGEVIPLLIHFSTLRKGDLRFTILHLTDISRRLQVERELQDSQRRLASIIETAVDGILTISDHGTVETMNPAAASLFGYEPHEVIDHNISMLMPEPDRSQHDGYLSNYLHSRQAKIIGIGREVKGRKKDGTIFPFYLSVSEVNLEDRKIFTGIIHDLSEQKAAEDALKTYSDGLEKRVNARTKALAHAIDGLEKEIRERKEIEEALIQSQEELRLALQKEKQLGEMKSRFVSMASHEFRTPLATILSSVSLVHRYQEKGDKEKAFKHVNRIKSNVQTLTQILNDFLSLSKLEEGKIDLKIEPVNVADLLTELVDELEGHAKSGQVVEINLEGLEGEILNLDPGLCKNIVYNLLSNAFKYSPEDATVSVTCFKEAETATLQVKDQGIGIPESEQIFMFERFFRAKNATNIQGTGLGLSIVKRYLDLMGGTISFESEEGKGTTFQVKIPLKIPVTT